MFHELLDNPSRTEPGRLQAAALKQFPDVVRRSHLNFDESGQSPPHSGKYALIGIAVYSPKELQLLDAIDANYVNWRGIATVAVFDLMECKKPQDVRTRFRLQARGPTCSKLLLQVYLSIANRWNLGWGRALGARDRTTRREKDTAR